MLMTGLLFTCISLIETQQQELEIAELLKMVACVENYRTPVMQRLCFVGGYVRARTAPTDASHD